MAAYKCKMCGGDLLIEAGMSVCECEYCGTKQTVPNADNEKKMTLFARAGRLLRGCEFDKAAGVFETIVGDYPEEAEAYWGLVLCHYGIEYVDDPATGKKVPTCHRSSFDSVMKNENFEQACENADAIARRVYRDEARAIEELRKGIIEVSGKEEPYDIFISYKETDDKGNRTLDSVIAQDIYDALTEKGYRVFFSRISLEDKLGTEYEPYIFAALNSAKVMLVVGTDYDHFDAVWVKNEWSRFLKLIAGGQKKTLIPCFKNMDAYDMPEEFAKLTAQDMGKIGAMQDLLRGVGKIVGKQEQKIVVEAQSEKSLSEMMDIINQKQAQYDAAVVLINKAKTESEFVKAAEIFLEVMDFKDAAELHKQALDKAQQAGVKSNRVRKMMKIAIPLVGVIAIVAALLAFVVIPTAKFNKEVEQLNQADIGDVVVFGQYEQDNNTTNGKEAIEWIVLDEQNDRVLLISKYALDCKRYDSGKYGGVWKLCSLRNWLNSEFINDAFTSKETRMIPIVTLPEHQTEDRLFILNEDEAYQFFASDEDRECILTAYAEEKGAYVNAENGKCWWWLRSVGKGYGSAAYINSFGFIDEITGAGPAVRPAMWIDLSE